MDERNIVGRALDALMEDERITPVQMAEEVLEESYQHFMKQRQGKRKVNSELIFKIALKRGLAPGKVGSYFVMKKQEKTDENGDRRVPALILYSARGDKAGKIEFITEAALRDMYPDYNPSAFEQYIEKYLGDRFYNAEYQKYLKSLEQENEITEVMNPYVASNGTLREIVKTIYKLDDTTLECLKDIIDAYIKHHGQKE